MAVKVRKSGAWVDVSGNSTSGTTRAAVLWDQKSADTDGGTFTQDAWQDRVLNSKTDPQTFVSWPEGASTGTDGTNDYFSLEAGTYLIEWSAPAVSVSLHKTQLLYANNSSFTSSTTVQGTSSLDASGIDPNSDTRSFGETILTITEKTYFKIQHQCTVTQPTYGFGYATDIGTVEVYTQVRIEDLATAIKDNATYVEGNGKVAYLYDQKDSGTDGGSFTQDAWRGRDLTTKSDPFSLISSFTATTDGTTTPSPGNDPGRWSLASGKYKIEWKACGLGVNRHKSRLTYATDSGFTTGVGYVYGSSSYSQDEEDTESFGVAILEPSASWYYKIEHYCKSTNSGGDGFGQASDISGVGEIYTQVVVEDLKTAVKDNATYVEGNSKVARIYDSKTQNTGAGSPSGTGFENRTLNTVDDPYSLIDLDSGNVYFSMEAGSYKINWRAPARDGQAFRSKLVYANNSSFTSSSEVLGESGQSQNTGWEPNNYNCGTAILTTTETTYFKIQQAQTVGNWGGACNLGGAEIYTQVFVEDLATAVKDDGTTYIKQIQHASGPATQTSYNSSVAWTTIVEKSITLSEANKVLIDVKAGFYGGSEGSAYQRGRIVRTTASSDSTVLELDTIWGRVESGSCFKGSIDGPTYEESPGVGTHTYKWQTIQHDAANSNDAIVWANGNSITLTEIVN